MLVTLATTLLLLGAAGDPPPSSTQLRDLIRTKTAPLKSLVFAYECQYRLKDDGNRNKDGASVHDQDFQGIFLYRSDGAALDDIHATFLARDGRVRRKKVSLFRGTTEETPEWMAAQEQPPKDDIRTRPGSLITMVPDESPTNLCAIWVLGGLCDNTFHDLAVEGWEPVGGRDCLRVRLSTFSGPDDHNKERSKRIY